MRASSLWEKVLLGGVWAGLVLILLTPFIVSPQTVFPFVVGKALYSRAIIEVVFALWVLLALMRPAYRPPRSWLLVLLGATLAVGLVSALLGANLQRSLWSSYERMGGLVASAHWFALAVVLASVVRTLAQWRLLLNLNLGASLGLAVLAVGQSQGLLKTPLLALHYGKVAATLGNESFLGSYAVLNALIALGFLFHSFAGRRAMNAPTTSNDGCSGPLVWLLRAFWASAALLNLWAFALTGMRGALIGLVAGLGFVVLLLTFTGRKRWFRRVFGALSLLAAGSLVVLLLLFLRPGVLLPDRAFSNPFLDSLTNSAHRGGLQTRMAAWAAGVEGFLDRPLTGWGAGNYILVFGRYANTDGIALPQGMRLPLHDHAHNQLLEEAATKGLLGVVSYLALWVGIFFAILRVVSSLGAKERVPILFLGAALAAHFLHSQTSVDSPTSTLQYVLLFACLASLQVNVAATDPAAPRTEREGQRRIWTWAAGVAVQSAHSLGITAFIIGLRRRMTSAWAQLRLDSLGWRSGGRMLLAAGALSLAGLGLSQNLGIHQGARAVWNAASVAQTLEQAFNYFRQAIVAFAPLANGPRRMLFNNAAVLWPRVQAEGDEARARMLALLEAEAAAALVSAPEDWRTHTVLANFYSAASEFNPAYEEKAKDHWDHALTLAPHIGGDALMLAPAAP